MGSYIVCEYATGQSLEMILSHGPLSGLEPHGSLARLPMRSPRTQSRSLSPPPQPGDGDHHPVRKHQDRRLLIEVALRPVASGVVHGADTPELLDVTDLGRLLYASLVCRWPGGPAFGLPNAPTVGQRWMTPRQVRAGVSPALDNVCDQILGDPPRHHAPAITTAGAIVTALTKVLGSADAAPDLERRLSQPIPTVGGRAPAPDPAVGAQPVSSLLDQTTTRQEAIRTHTIPAASAPPTTQRTRVSTGRPPQGPATPSRRVNGPATPNRPRGPGPVPRRQTSSGGGGAGSACCGARGAADRGGNHLRDHLGSATSGLPESEAQANKRVPHPTAPDRAKKLTIADARDFDPQGEDKTENPTRYVSPTTATRPRAGVRFNTSATRNWAI